MTHRPRLRLTLPPLSPWEMVMGGPSSERVRAATDASLINRPARRRTWLLHGCEVISNL